MAETRERERGSARPSLGGARGGARWRWPAGGGSKPSGGRRLWVRPKRGERRGEQERERERYVGMN